MCDTSAYMIKDGGSEELILESLQILKVNNGSIEITNIFGEQKTVDGKIKELNFMDNKVLIEG